MPKFELNVPVTQADPRVEVEVSREAPLPIGLQRFRLVVADDAGNESEPTLIDVVVRDADRPTAVLDLLDREGRRADPVVDFGSPFVLSGERSADLPPGKVIEYRFTLVERG